ncbi:MAG: RNA polymerase sigma factor [Muribaculaceae bacterium]|nr:RNA polymerase sigma factor [Muribaculaceae bacterium]
MGFDDLVVGHIEWIARLAFRFHKCRADAEDLAQETLYRIFANRDKFNNARDFKPWALTIMTNIFKTRYARINRAPFVSMEDDYDATSPMMADEMARFNDVVEAVHRSARQSVGVECVLLFAQGYSYDEIADIIGINPGTVKSRISAGRKLIRSCLEK